MPYIRLSDHRVMTESEVRAQFPQTSFPAVFPCPEGYAVVFISPAPAYDPMTQGNREITPVQVNGKWYQAFETFALSDEQVTANQAAAVQRANDEIKRQIAEIESKQGRAMREAALTGNNTYLQSIEDQIQALRSQLQ